MRKVASWVLVVIAVLGWTAHAHDLPSLDRLISSVVPRPDEERWLQIPWRIDLQRARSEAAASGKLLFLWVMDGHPMGCT